MTNLLGNIIKDKRNIKNQLGSIPESSPALKKFSSATRIRRLFTKQFVIDPADSFVLGSATLGVLGTSKLGDRSVELDNFVFPHRNVVEENLADLLFIDDSVTTATVSDGEATFTDGQLLQSKTVAKIRQTISSLLLSEFNVTGAGNALVEVTVDGTTWQPITQGVRLNLTGGTPEDILKYRITSTGAVTVTAPIKIQVN